MRVKKILTFLLVILVLSSFGLFACSAQVNSNEVSSVSAATVSAASESPTISTVVTQVRPSVVSINVEITTYDYFNQPVKEEGAGSGWIIKSNGYIVTNNHVVADSDNVTVTLSDGRIYQAETVSTDSLTDLAVIKINATGLTVLPVGDSSALLVGDGVVAIGNALGQGISATAGIVSVTDVSLDASPGQTLLGLIQTDAAINPGNSGGPLVNMAGEVIGINSIKIAQVGIEGMGYAISINEALPVINTLIEKGQISRPWMGIGVSEVNEFVASLYSLAVNEGVLITNIVTGSPAEKSGLKEGDVITMMNDTNIVSTRDLAEELYTSKIGEKISVTYWRSNVKQTTELTLTKMPSAQ
ncbi:MAG: trypsin-like peptidase domain-containing protein [Dehalococcoidales bacterium]|nr:trypsin-like peptidase domain-containing protein [Dehalococcoidales bacterium]